MGFSAEVKEAGNFESLSAIRLSLFIGVLILLTIVAWLFERSRPGTLNVELVLGAISGVLLGVAAILSRVMMLSLSAKHFILFGIMTGLVVALNLVSVGLQQGGFQRGRAMTINAILTVLNKFIAVIGGFLAMGEALPDDPLMRGLRLGGLGGLLVGTILLSAFNESRLDDISPKSAGQESAE